MRWMIVLCISLFALVGCAAILDGGSGENVAVLSMTADASHPALADGNSETFGESLPKADPREFQDTVAMHYVFRNDEEHGVGPGILLPGKVRLFEQDATGSVAFLGEDILPFVPDGDEVRLALGPARDIEVERTIMTRERKNVRRNNKG